MPRQPTLTAYLRTTKHGAVWYASWYENAKRMVRPTGIERKPKRGDEGRAEAIEAGRRLRDAHEAARPGENTRLADYAAPFFVWETCPHVRRLLDEGREITRRWCNHQRTWLQRYVTGDAEKGIEPDPLALRPMGEISRADLVDFRSRILAELRGKRNTANKVMGVIKVVFKEALFREEIGRDPTFGLGTMKERRRVPGTFTEDELRALFPGEGLGPWKDKSDYACFLLAAETGMRRGELMVLRWGSIDFDKARVYVREAWKGGQEIGTPKWGRMREFSLPTFSAVKLQELRERSRRTAPTDFVFCDVDGKHVGETWWTQRFHAAMKKAKIDTKARGITAHSFRHTLNSLLLAKGADPLKVRLALGWASARIQENYLHMGPNEWRDVSDKVDAIFER